ncbi:MAG: hypothetical protein ACREFZ_08630, partial [Acetobacteraceae bacterium]
MLDNFLGRVSNPFYRINSQDELHDDTIDRITGEPFAMPEFMAIESGNDAPDDLQRRLGRFLAESFVNEYETLFRHVARDASNSADATEIARQVRRLRDLNPFRARLTPPLERHLIQVAAARSNLAMLPAAIQPAVTASTPEPLPTLRARSAHQERFRQRVANLQHVRAIGLAAQAARRHSVLIIGAGPAGLIHAISATLRG